MGNILGLVAVSVDLELFYFYLPLLCTSLTHYITRSSDPCFPGIAFTLLFKKTDFGGKDNTVNENGSWKNSMVRLVISSDIHTFHNNNLCKTMRLKFMDETEKMIFITEIIILLKINLCKCMVKIFSLNYIVFYDLLITLKGLIFAGINFRGS